MRKLLVLLVITVFFTAPVNALEFSPPTTPPIAEKFMPEESISFEKDLWYIVKEVLREVAPGISEAMSICASVIAVQLFISMVQSFNGIAKKTIHLTGIVALSILLLKPSRALISLGVETIQLISEYNKLLLPVMTAALASQGGATMSAALYAGTVMFDTLLSIMISKVILPLLYAYIALGIAFAAIDEQVLGNLLGFIKWLVTWLLKIVIYVFTGYMGITGVISGTVDAAALKATKLAISGTVPVIGNIISDASETILIGTGIVKNATGVYGILVILTLWLAPFLKIGIQYLLLKITAGIVSFYSDKQAVSVVNHICTAMGFILAMTCTVCLLLLISVVCFMKGFSQ